MFARLKPRAALLSVALAAISAPALAAITVVEGYSGPPTYYAPATTTYYVPATNTYYVPRTTVIAPRASEDELINAAVADRIITNPRINGTIGIETERNVVTLSGRVTTPGMAREAVREAPERRGRSRRTARLPEDEGGMVILISFGSTRNCTRKVKL